MGMNPSLFCMPAVFDENEDDAAGAGAAGFEAVEAQPAADAASRALKTADALLIIDSL